MNSTNCSSLISKYFSLLLLLLSPLKIGGGDGPNKPSSKDLAQAADRKYKEQTQNTDRKAMKRRAVDVARFKKK